MVEDVPTLLAISRMDVPTAAGSTDPAPMSGSEVATPRIAGATESQVHRDSQWRGIGNPDWIFVNCRASGSPAAGRSRNDSPQAVEREYEERWVQRGAQERMTLEELIRWRRQEERLIHGEDPHSAEDQASPEDEESLGEREVPPERDAPPERSDPPERAEPPT